MRLVLPRPPARYDPADQTRLRAELERRLARVFEAGGDLDLAGGRLILTSPGGLRFALGVGDDGTLGVTPL